MEIILGKTAGFCYGVKNAVEKAETYAKQQKVKSIFCLGELVHNREVIEKGCEMLGLSLDDVIKETIEGMRECADAIGLRGNIDGE